MKDVFNGWLNIYDLEKGCFHVVPLQDLSPHYRYDCPCTPSHEVGEDGTPWVLHNAFDGRDAIKH